MRSLLNYVPAAVAFITTFVGLMGPSRRPDKTGLAALTPFGWGLCAIAAISLTVALYLQYRKERELTDAQIAKRQLREVVTSEMNQGVESLRDVLRYAALMPYVSTAITEPGVPEKVPYSAYAASRKAWDIDLRSDDVLTVLERLYLSPDARLKGPFIPEAVPFGTQITKPCMHVIAEQTRAAREHIETAVQKYSSVGLDLEVIGAISKVTTSPFPGFLGRLEETWVNRSRMEDSTRPQTLNFRFLDSGNPGGSKQQYLDFVDRMDELTKLLNASK